MEGLDQLIDKCLMQLGALVYMIKLSRFLRGNCQ